MPADGEFDDLGIGGFAAAAVDELVATARADGEDADDARAALALLLRLAETGSGMKLHRLVLTNYRGIAHREIEFPDRGVVVVSGANEIGKSSMIEALDLLLEAKDRSPRKRSSRSSRRTPTSVAEITAEISTGPYRFVYRKRFHKRAETQLTVLAPRREQLTGDEAHERVRAMLAETVDPDLWQAQRVLQSASTAPVDLSGCDALARALDVAAGEAATLSGAEPLLIDRIDAEYPRYFTATGRPTGEWAAAVNRLQAADAEVARCAARGRRGRRRGARHACSPRNSPRLPRERAQAAQRLDCGAGGGRRRGVLAQQLKEAEVLADAAHSHARGFGCGADRTSPAAGRHRRADRGDRANSTPSVREAAEETGHRRARCTSRRGRRRGGARGGRGQPGTRRGGPRRPSSGCPTATRPTGWPPGSPRSTPPSASSTASTASWPDRARPMRAMRAIEAAGVAVERAAGQAELASARIELVGARRSSTCGSAGEPVTLRAGASLVGRTPPRPPRSRCPAC